ncbi:MAG: thioredoxin-dependent thiol peroxidase [Rhodospirillales bacterium]|nr:thioredoxin-dependent thiol peroxidase [Rhodospirillales bacterium]
MTLAAGSPAPDFTLMADDGKPLTLSSFKGKPVVLYFYPKDDTPGCTREACAFQENKARFAKAKAQVIGVSRDSTERHARFKQKYGLEFPLVADPEAQLCKTYGVWKEKVLYGKKSLGIERSTFLIDATGVVRKIWRKVKVEGHEAEVLAALNEL